MVGNVDPNTVLIIRNLWDNGTIIEVNFNAPNLRAFWINVQDEAQHEISTNYEINQGETIHVISNNRRNVLLYNGGDEERHYEILFNVAGLPFGSASAKAGF